MLLPRGRGCSSHGSTLPRPGPLALGTQRSRPARTGTPHAGDRPQGAGCRPGKHLSSPRTTSSLCREEGEVRGSVLGTRSHRRIGTGQGSSWLPALRRAAPCCCSASGPQTQWPPRHLFHLPVTRGREFRWGGAPWRGHRRAAFSCGRAGLEGPAAPAGPRAALAPGPLGSSQHGAPHRQLLSEGCLEQ